MAGGYFYLPQPVRVVKLLCHSGILAEMDEIVLAFVYFWHANKYANEPKQI